MNKILFNYNEQDDIILVANNEKDLLDYFEKNFDWYNVEIVDNQFAITERPGFATVYVDIVWVTHI